MVNLVFFLISLLATTVGAISGIGGGVIIKPVLDAFGLLSVSTISFLSGLHSAFHVGGVAAEKPRQRRETGSAQKHILAIGAAVGGVVGKYLFDLMKGWFPGDAVVGAVQSALLAAMTVFVFFFVRYKSKIAAKQVQNSFVCLLIGLVLGMLSAFLGIGGGPINIAVLYYFFSMDAKTSARNSIYIILFSQITSLVRTFAAGAVPDFDPWLLALMIAGGVGGGFLGSAISRKLTNDGVDKLFSGVMLVIILVSCYNFVRFVI